MSWKGLIMAGGGGSRLGPLTQASSKHLLPLFDKPMIYYSLSVLMIAEIREVIIVVSGSDEGAYRKLLGNGDQFGIHITFVVQPTPGGIAEGILLSESLIANTDLCVVLGDNFFYGQGFKQYLNDAMENAAGATVFTYQVANPSKYGIAELNESGELLSITEKPEEANSNYAITGLYFYDSSCLEKAHSLKKSKRQELEITDLNNIYLRQSKLKHINLGRGFAWLDLGTPVNLLKAGQFVETIQTRQGLKIACLEEIAFRNGWISSSRLLLSAKRYLGTDYGKYLANIPFV